MLFRFLSVSFFLAAIGANTAFSDASTAVQVADPKVNSISERTPSRDFYDRFYYKEYTRAYCNLELPDRDIDYIQNLLNEVQMSFDINCDF